ncbi:hypothetical protein [Nitrincola iocasae]|uniref:Lysozyme inhibitor LprI N-terminal domain-containing protein n=1 Tax=Nitrincola iocasae TaxID=2614693 RepID=A0A5J6LCF5_9GAMM|nr:hypothetical protein [Nitrincola iocasae]QEW05892.1 hypothetical protein F5I99_04980 [Nitrincola iocasae]
MNLIKSISVFFLLISSIYSVYAEDNKASIEYYNKCIEDQGGISNGAIVSCTNEVIRHSDEIIMALVDEISMVDNYPYEKPNQAMIDYEIEMKEMFESSIYPYFESSANICKYFSFHVGGPAGPICNMDFRLQLLEALKRYR